MSGDPTEFRIFQDSRRTAGDERKKLHEKRNLFGGRQWRRIDADGGARASSDARQSSQFLPSSATVRIQFFQLPPPTPHGFGVVSRDFHFTRLGALHRNDRADDMSRQFFLSLISRCQYLAERRSPAAARGRKRVLKT